MTWGAIRDGMKTVLTNNLTGVTAYSVMPSSINNDAAVVLPSDPLIQSAGHGGLDEVFIRVVARVYRGSVKDAQDRVDAMIQATGTASIRAAINADRTLNNSVQDTMFMRVENYGALQNAEGVFQADVIFRAITVDI